MSSKPAIAIVILNWNGKSLLGEFLPSVLMNSDMEGVSVYIADNSSTDGSPEFLKSSFPGVKLILLDRNYGFSGGYNRALEQVEADYFILLNSDVEVTPGWIEPCIRCMEEDPLIVAVQPKVMSYQHKDRFEYSGAAGGFIDCLGYPFCRGRILTVTEADRGQYDKPVAVFWATGASLFIRASAFRGAGGFDEDFFAHMEEIDLCWRMKNRGWVIRVEPSSTVYHLGGATLSYQSPDKVFYNFRNSLWMLVKNLPKGKLLPVLTARLILDGVAALNFLVRGEYASVRAVWRAHMAFYRSLPLNLKKRAALLSLQRIHNHAEIFRRSMVFGFYIRKRKIFSQLWREKQELSAKN